MDSLNNRVPYAPLLEELTVGMEAAIPQLALSAAVKVARLGPANCHALISCSKTKATHRDFARNMYASPLFRKSVLTTERWKVPFSILSAKFGLLDPDELIEPYEEALKGKSKQYRKEWGERVSHQIRTSIPSEKTLIVLAGDDYLVPLASAAIEDQEPLYAPMRGLSLGSRLAFLNYCIRLDDRKRAMTLAYELFAEIGGRFGFHSLKRLLQEDIPTHGVYFFFDETEPTLFSSSLPRLVRIGTHGVSSGSTATLRTRLRTHLGTRLGSGNHRASVFRLHVGRAIIERDGLHSAYPHWGKGQAAPSDITRSEASLEAKVSDYISKLRVIYVPVIDAAGTKSMRATIERQMIALFSELLCAPDAASEHWLWSVV